MPFNIVLIEDDREHRDELSEALCDDYGHDVRAFRDLVTFQSAVHNDVALFDAEHPLLVMLDIMLSAELDPEALYAPRWDNTEPPSEDERRHFVDDELGLGIAFDIRGGDYAPTVPADTPILFFTARQNTHVKDEIEKVGRATWLSKPKFARRIQEALEVLAREHSADDDIQEGP